MAYDKLHTSFSFSSNFLLASIIFAFNFVLLLENFFVLLKEARYNKNLSIKFLYIFLLFIIGKYVKTMLKNRESPCYFLSSTGEKIKNITKIEQTRLFLLTFLLSFFMAFLAQKLIYTINI